MENSNHRVGVSEMNFVTRHLKLNYTKGSADEQQSAEMMLKEIDQTFGVDSVSFADKENNLTVAYDASHFDIEHLEVVLPKYGFEVAHQWWNNLKESYYKFTDQNIKDNAEHQPSCCHKPPTGRK
ncbi:MAG: hypothetical protein COB35_01325 [Gammaproteobacteria bacterium]|nr:MAG: hypothetical protein COB35_01325 [Gammaproteobacteria bacterium]